MRIHRYWFREIQRVFQTLNLEKWGISNKMGIYSPEKEIAYGKKNRRWVLSSAKVQVGDAECMHWRFVLSQMNEEIVDGH